jgi:hypothetical protein
LKNIMSWWATTTQLTTPISLLFSKRDGLNTIYYTMLEGTRLGKLIRWGLAFEWHCSNVEKWLHGIFLTKPILNLHGCVQSTHLLKRFSYCTCNEKYKNEKHLNMLYLDSFKIFNKPCMALKRFLGFNLLLNC